MFTLITILSNFNEPELDFMFNLTKHFDILTKKLYEKRPKSLNYCKSHKQCRKFNNTENKPTCISAEGKTTAVNPENL